MIVCHVGSPVGIVYRAALGLQIDLTHEGWACNGVCPHGTRLICDIISVIVRGAVRAVAAPRRGYRPNASRLNWIVG